MDAGLLDLPFREAIIFLNIKGIDRPFGKGGSRLESIRSVLVKSAKRDFDPSKSL
jgi:hypothetical protein